MPATPSTSRFNRTLRLLCAVALAASVLWAAFTTRHWPIVGDAPLFHYIVFLLDHGKAPYREIVDINMPGTYALQWFAIHALGPGAAGWRVFDYLLLTLSGAAMLAILWPEDPLAGFFAATLYALIHFRDGPTHTGQRDLMMTTFLLIATAALFRIKRHPGLWPAILFGISAGMVTIIKPSGIFFAVALAALWFWRTRPQPAVATTALSTFCLPIVLCFLWLLHHDALRAFLATNRGLVAYHASLGRPGLLTLIVGSFPSVLLAVVIPAAPIFFAEKLWRRWDVLVLLICAALGAVSYILQGKGFPYHRYPTEAFLLLLCGLILVPALRSTGWRKCFAIAGVLLGALYLAPTSAAIATHYDAQNLEFNHELQSDLTNLSGPALTNQVQCIDMTSGCLAMLYNMQLVQSTGYLYDCYLFQPTQTPVTLAYREGFLQALTAARPKVLVVTNQRCFSFSRDWTQPDSWPQFNAYLNDHYTLTKQYTPPHLVAWWRKPAVPYAYRLYVRREP